MKPIHIATSALALAACTGESLSPPVIDKSLPGPAPDAIYTGGRIYTVDPAHPTATAMAVRGGRIVGFDDEVSYWLARAEFPRSRVHPLGGRTVIPGFIDAHNHIFERIDDMGLEELDEIHAALRGLEDRLLANGVTAQGIPGPGRGILYDLEEYDDSEGFRVRTSVYVMYNGVCDLASNNYYLTETPLSDPTLRFRIPGIKVFADGGACRYTDASGVEHEKWPALSFPGHTRHVPAEGEAYLDVGELENLIREAEQRGWQLAVHAVGDRGRERVLTAFRLAMGENRLHHRIEHNTVIRPDQVAAYTATDVVPVVWGLEATCREVALDPDESWRGTLGPSRWSWYRPWAALIAANPDVHLAWHTDVLRWTPLDAPLWKPMSHFLGFVSRVERAADGHFCLPSQDLAANRLSRARALRTMTLDAAYALGLDTVTGSLEVGKFADFVILSDDLMNVPGPSLDQIRVLATFVEGDAHHCHPDAGGACVPTL